MHFEIILCSYLPYVLPCSSTPRKTASGSFCQKALNTREKPKQGKRPKQDSQKSEKEALGRTRMQKTKDKVYIEANDIQV